MAVDQPDDEDLIGTLCSVMNSMVQITWQLLKEQTTTMQLLLQTIEEGFPEKQADTPKEIREYHTHLYSTDGVAVYKDRVIIPATLREDCLKALHAAHHGVTMMLSKAEASIFWPGIAADISHHRSTCSKCNEMSPSQSSLPPTAPTRSRLFPRGHRGPILQLAHCRTLVQRGHWPCRELAIHIRNLRHSRRYHN